MGEPEEQLQAEIHEVQGQLGETLEALRERVNPKQVVQQAKVKARDKLDDVTDKVSPPRFARRQVDKVKDKLGNEPAGHEPDEAGAGHVDHETRKRIAEAARKIEAEAGPTR